jgi:hypothetical protein
MMGNSLILAHFVAALTAPARLAAAREVEAIDLNCAPPRSVDVDPLPRAPRKLAKHQGMARKARR